MDCTEIIPDRLWIGAAPSRGDLAELKRLLGSELVVMDLTRNPEEEEWCRELGIAYDDRTPKVEVSILGVPLSKLKVASAILGDNIDSGRKVLLHCLRGRGRSPTCAAAYMIQSGMSVSEGKNAITSKREVWDGLDADYLRHLEEFAKIMEITRSAI